MFQCYGSFCKSQFEKCYLFSSVRLLSCCGHPREMKTQHLPKAMKFKLPHTGRALRETGSVKDQKIVCLFHFICVIIFVFDRGTGYTVFSVWMNISLLLLPFNPLTL